MPKSLFCRCSPKVYRPGILARASLWLLLPAVASTAQAAPADDVYDEIARIESEQGAFGASLGEHLLSLATGYQARGKHVEAVEAFKRALHVQRINEGLYSMNQVPAMEAMIESQIALGDWDEAAKRHSHMYWLHQRNFGVDDPRMLPMLEKMSSWHLNAFSLSPVNIANHLLSAHQLFAMSIDIIDKNYGREDMQMIKPLKGLAVSNYYLATLKAEQSRRSAMMTTSSNGNDTAQAERKARLDHYILNSYYNGKQAITKMIDIYETADHTDQSDLIAAHVQLGDWYMMFDRSNAAMGQYELAFDKIATTNTLDEFSKELFDKPHALPDMPLLETQAHNPNQPHDYVLVKFDVTSRGEARNVDILESKPENHVGNRAMVRRSLKSAKFRPRMVAGKPVDTKGIVHRYILPKS
ncbi:hypothetical protein GCM10025791_34160 [Halioxenophilus aromaticivorans]|uniref:TonB C-terminal domain-containing protein n=2 Tax=Halioxenophilus aromaticivorans TaxID=1306992 RepID=A0AAV3U676_9ALTE